MTPKLRAAIEEGTTLYRKSVRAPEGETVLKRSSNQKLGRRITRGRWRGMPIYTLTLQERATCPRDCPHWQDCYGNNMPFAHRFNAESGLEGELGVELAILADKHPRGFAVRLHVLGDFYSVAYVAKWGDWLTRYPMLHVWGYSARHPGMDPIGNALQSVKDGAHGSRFRIRWSGGARRQLEETADPAEWDTRGFLCPEQTEKLPSCGACALCWESSQPVRFMAH